VSLTCEKREKKEKREKIIDVEIVNFCFFATLRFATLLDCN
jgi:hypothetical protein